MHYHIRMHKVTSLVKISSQGGNYARAIGDRLFSAFLGIYIKMLYGADNLRPSMPKLHRFGTRITHATT